MAFTRLFLSTLLAANAAIFAAASANDGLAARAVCNADNCARAVTGTFRGLATQNSRLADCTSFFALPTAVATDVPIYASACSGTSRYSSACFSCANVPTAAPQPCSSDNKAFKNVPGFFDTGSTGDLSAMGLNAYSLLDTVQFSDVNCCMAKCAALAPCYLFLYKKTTGACRLYNGPDGSGLRQGYFIADDTQELGIFYPPGQQQR